MIKVYRRTTDDNETYIYYVEDLIELFGWTRLYQQQGYIPKENEKFLYIRRGKPPVEIWYERIEENGNNDLEN